MCRTACTEPQCLYSTAIPLLPLWAVRPVQSLTACTVELYLYSPYGQYALYRASLLVQGCTLPLIYLLVVAIIGKKKKIWNISVFKDEDTALSRNDGIRLPTEAAAYHVWPESSNTNLFELGASEPLSRYERHTGNAIIIGRFLGNEKQQQGIFLRAGNIWYIQTVK